MLSPDEKHSAIYMKPRAVSALWLKPDLAVPSNNIGKCHVPDYKDVLF